MKTTQINNAVLGGREQFRVHLTGGNVVTGRITEVHPNWILMRYIHHPGLEDLRIIVDTDAIVAIEEQ